MTLAHSFSPSFMAPMDCCGHTTRAAAERSSPRPSRMSPVPLLAQNPTQNYHLPEQSIWLKGEKDACPEKNVSNRGVEMKPNQTLRCYDS